MTLTYRLQFWYLRARLLKCATTSNQVFSGLALEDLLEASGYTMEQFRSYSGLYVVAQAEWDEINAGLAEEKAKAERDAEAVTVTLDGTIVNTTENGERLARVVNGRTIIPIRSLTEQLGADVSMTPT